MKFIFSGLYKQFIKNMGRTPDSSEINMLKKQARNIEQSDKIIQFPGGGKNKISPFKPRPKKSLDEFKKTEDAFEKSKKIKPDLKVAETEAETIARMNKQNKDSVARLKKKKEKNLGDMLKDYDGDPDAMAMGGLAGLLGEEPRSEYSGGGGTGAPPITYGPGINIPGSPKGIPTGKIGPVDIGVYGGGGYSKNQVVPGVNQATTNQNFGITAQVPIGNSGFSVGGNYMKSRVNDRFKGEAIPNETYKNVPVDNDRFNVGINFRKSLSGGKFGLADGGRIGFKEGSKKSLGSKAKDFLLGSPNAIKFFGGLDAMDQIHLLLGLPGLYAKGGRAKFASGSETKKMTIVKMLNKDVDFDTIKSTTNATEEEMSEAIKFFKYGGAGVPLPTFDSEGNMVDDGLYKGKKTRPEYKPKGGLSGLLGE